MTEINLSDLKKAIEANGENGKKETSKTEPKTPPTMLILFQTTLDFVQRMYTTYAENLALPTPLYRKIIYTILAIATMWFSTLLCGSFTYYFVKAWLQSP